MRLLISIFFGKSSATGGADTPGVLCGSADVVCADIVVAGRENWENGDEEIGRFANARGLVVEVVETAAGTCC